MTKKPTRERRRRLHRSKNRRSRRHDDRRNRHRHSQRQHLDHPRRRPLGLVATLPNPLAASAAPTRIAYAYLMYQKNKTLTEDAEKRLKVIKEFTELGSGYQIAVRDLFDPRAPATSLAANNPGFIDSVGIDLYMKILQEEISYQQGAPEKSAPIAKIKAQVSRYIDETYVEDDFIKLEMHGKINHVQTLAEAHDLLEDPATASAITAPISNSTSTKRCPSITPRSSTSKNFSSENQRLAHHFPEGSKRIAGDRLFRAGNETSNFIRFAYKEDRIHVILDTIRLQRHWLYTMVEFLERILP
ncbi:MAG: hypothetical protein MZU97_15120 [Bacillus subtilis]|nr:hypothetical protein [Bacillus subtilis]